MRKHLTQKQAYKLGIEFQLIEPIPMGPLTSYSLLHDPIHMSFVLARYKFVARMFTSKSKVLEIGCGDAPGTAIVAQFVDKVIAVDLDKRLIEDNKKRLAEIKNIEFRVFDFCSKSPREKFDAIYSIDVIEHLDPELTDRFMENTKKSLDKNGVVIVGTPNITADKYASPQSKIQHINLQSHKTLQNLISRYFNNVFMFSMNDEGVHTGFPPMAHYLWGMGVGVKG